MARNYKSSGIGCLQADSVFHGDTVARDPESRGRQNRQEEKDSEQTVIVRFTVSGTNLGAAL